MFWQIISSRPSHAGIHYPTASGEHPQTPKIVRTRYLAEVGDGRPVVWSEAGLAAIRCGVDEVVVRVDAQCVFRLRYARPAKGPGFVSLDFVNAVGRITHIASAFHFEQSVLTWHAELAYTFGEATRAKIEMLDEGTDAQLGQEEVAKKWSKCESCLNA